MLVNKEFKEHIKGLDNEDKVISFKYVIRGFKIHRAVVMYDKDLDRVFLRCFRGDLRKIELPEETDKKEISVEDDEIDSMDLDAMDV